MPWVTYKATESIAPGHTLNVTYTLSFSIVKADPRYETLKREQRSLSGKKEALYYGNITRWSVTMEPVPAEMIPYYEEFLRSTADGQAFTFDPYGTELNPKRPITVDREDSGHTQRRVTMTGDPVYSDMTEFSFEASERS
jgi:hypothetical protein